MTPVYVELFRIMPGGQEAIFRYWIGSKIPGTLIFDLYNAEAKVGQVAELDWVITVPLRTLIKRRNNENRRLIAQGLPPLTEEEYPTPREPLRTYFYGEQAISRIYEFLEKEGNLPRGLLGFESKERT